MQMGTPFKTGHGLNLSKLLISDVNNLADAGGHGHLITASLDGSMRIVPLDRFDRQEEKDGEFTTRSAQMFSHHRGGIAKLDAFSTANGGILLLAVDAGGTLQLLQTQHGEANQDGCTLFANPHVDIELKSMDYAEEGFDLGCISAALEHDIRSEGDQQSWTAWKTDMESRERRKDFEREIDHVEKSLTTVKEEIDNLMSSTSSLPGEERRKTLNRPLQTPKRQNACIFQ